MPHISLTADDLKDSIPSPQGDLRVVMWRTLVGILTGPLTLSCLSLAPFTKSAQTEIYQKKPNNHQFAELSECQSTTQALYFMVQHAACSITCDQNTVKPQ